jgi:hypothetical protein
MADRRFESLEEQRRRRENELAGDRNRGDYNPYDPRNYDSGGFGFGGTSGSAGGYGAGGMGPQTGYGSQANYGQGYSAGDYDPEDIDDRFPDQAAPQSRRWGGGLPRNSIGWGPQAPDYNRSVDPGRDLGYTPRNNRRPWQDYGMRKKRDYAEEMGTAHHDDPHYMSWRDEQVRKLDDDYAAYRSERQVKFNDEFDTWRKTRDTSRATGSASDADLPLKKPKAAE